MLGDEKSSFLSIRGMAHTLMNHPHLPLLPLHISHLVQQRIIQSSRICSPSNCSRRKCKRSLDTYRKCVGFVTIRPKTNSMARAIVTLVTCRKVQKVGTISVMVLQQRSAWHHVHSRSPIAPHRETVGLAVKSNKLCQSPRETFSMSLTRTWHMLPH